MKILVLSDSHRMTRNMVKVFEKLSKIDMIVHLGDCFDDLYVFKKKYPKMAIHGITGNCDLNVNASSEMVLDINDKKIFITHGHKYSVKFDFVELIYGAQEKEADVCLFGHTHQPDLFEDSGIIFMNPGSITFPRDIYGPSYGILDIDENSKIGISIVELDQKVIFQL